MSNAPAESPASATVPIVVNGEAREVPKGLSIESLLQFLTVDASRVAVEHNREIVRKTEWAATPIEAGDHLEVVWFVGGGSR